jgi:hypothetical protein
MRREGTEIPNPIFGYYRFWDCVTENVPSSAFLQRPFSGRTFGRAITPASPRLMQAAAEIPVLIDCAMTLVRN